jgi:hypothetical protein
MERKAFPSGAQPDGDSRPCAHTFGPSVSRQNKVRKNPSQNVSQNMFSEKSDPNSGIPCLIPYNTYMSQTGIGISPWDQDFRISFWICSKQGTLRLFRRAPVMIRLPRRGIAESH